MLIDAPIRGHDKWGSGAYQASRVGSDGTRHSHKGDDIACCAGSTIFAQSSGKVTKIGYPYPPDHPAKGHYRYVQITDTAGNRVRYFYVAPTVKLDAEVKRGEPIGVTQGVTKVYPGITDHFHFEVLQADGEPMDPELYLREVADK